MQVRVMTQQNKQQGILVELDCLLDTRMATLNRLDPVAAERVLQSGTYHTRKSDEFAGVDYALYQQMYESRNVETLKHAAPTQGFAFIKEIVRLLRDQAVQMNSPYRGDPVVIVNTYPYQLSNEELDEVGKSTVVLLGGDTPVELISASPAELAPAFVRAKCVMMLMYSYEQWLDAQFNVDPSKHSVKDLFGMVLPDITLFSPAIYHKPAPSEEVEQQLVRDATHPLRGVEMLAGALVGLHLIDVAHFSIFRPSTRRA